MKTTHTHCLVCKSSLLETQFECKDYFVSGELFTLFKCADCGFVFTQDIPDQAAITPYYQSEDYISHSDTQKGIVNKLYHKVRIIMLGRKFRLIDRWAPGKRLLDIGCGTGYFPNYMKSKSYDSIGMEVEPEARQFAADNFGLNVYSPDDLLQRDIKDAYDVITLWHVMEHLHKPEQYLNWIHQSLSKEGVLLIALPNCNSYDAKHFREYWAAYDVPRHLWHFAPDTFKKYLDQFGFDLVKIKRMPFDAYYNSLMSARYKGSKIALVTGFLVGFLSNVKSLFCPKTSSSVIYILKKK